MSAQSAMGAPFVLNGVKYPMIRMKGYAELESALRDKRRQQARAIAADSGLKGEERSRDLREAETRPISMFDVDDFVQTAEGMRLALQLSLRKDGKTEQEADEMIDELDPIDARKIARVVLGFIDIAAPDPKAESGSGTA